MTLEEFAIESGVTIIECDPSWGGPVGYVEDDYPNSSVNGFRTQAAAYREWLNSTFGERTFKALVKLLKQTQRKRSAHQRRVIGC